MSHASTPRSVKVQLDPTFPAHRFPQVTPDVVADVAQAISRDLPVWVDVTMGEVVAAQILPKIEEGPNRRPQEVLLSVRAREGAVTDYGRPLFFSVAYRSEGFYTGARLQGLFSAWAKDSVRIFGPEDLTPDGFAARVAATVREYSAVEHVPSDLGPVAR